MRERALELITAAVIAVPLLALAALHAWPQHDPLIMRNHLHFWSVGATALASAIACGVIVAGARTLRETRLLFLALAFVSIGGIFSVHGLLTPHVLVETFYPALAVSSWASVLAGSAFVALSAAPLPRSIERAVARAGAAIFAWATVGIALYITLSFRAERWLDWAPTDERAAQYLIAATATALFAYAAYRYWQAFQFARLPSQGAMVIALALLADVPAILLWGQLWAFSWWMYHLLYGAAFVVLFAGWAYEARRAGSLNVIADALSMRDALAALDRGRDAHLIELVDAIETKDRATLGHVRRVSAYALAAGRELRLGATELRDLALAAEMHDVGKIGVPDQILAKPGRLTPDEHAEMQRHAQRGGRIASGVRSLRGIAAVIGAHHERLNGAGYPDGLRGEQIPFLARIIAVADTYDAMTSDRPYRRAMSHDEAVAELERVRGVELDAACVDALVRSLDTRRAAA